MGRLLKDGLDTQHFGIDVYDEAHPFANDKNIVDFGFHKGWFAVAKALSLEYPDLRVSCHTMARVRRVYVNGELVKDNKEWPYLGTAEEVGAIWEEIEE